MNIDKEIAEKQAELDSLLKIRDADLIKQQQEKKRKEKERLEERKRKVAEAEKARVAARNSLVVSARSLYQAIVEDLENDKTGYEWERLALGEVSEIRISDNHVIKLIEKSEESDAYDGGEYWLVFSVEIAGILDSYWKVPGWSSSYDGIVMEWSNLFRVNQETIQVKVWKKA